jgi:23S rRNA (guanosine2251-2'-O)-methyltransferase
MIIYGINPVLEALRAGRVKELRVGDRADDRVKQLLALAAERGVRVTRVPADLLERESRRGVHQGVVADVEKSADYSVDEIVRSASGAPLLVVLDGIEDPHNLGAILRTAMPPAWMASSFRAAGRRRAMVLPRRLLPERLHT